MTSRKLVGLLGVIASLVAVDPAEPPAPPPEPREAGAPVRLPKGDSNRAERRANEKHARKAAKRKGVQP